MKINPEKFEKFPDKKHYITPELMEILPNIFCKRFKPDTPHFRKDKNILIKPFDINDVIRRATRGKMSSKDLVNIAHLSREVRGEYMTESERKMFRNRHFTDFISNLK